MPLSSVMRGLCSRCYPWHELTMKRPIKIAVVGLGTFGKLHAETILGLGEAVLVAVCDVDAGRVKQSARAWNVPHVFSDFGELAGSKLADAVIIASHSATHAPLASLALRSGLDVFLEKPAATNEGELTALSQLRRETGRVLMVDHICLFHSLVSPLLQRTSQCGFRAAHFVRHRPASLGRKFPEETPLSLLMVHDFCVAAQLAAGEEPVEWQIAEAAEANGRIDMTWVMCRWRDGRVATFHSHLTLPAGSPSDGWDSIDLFGHDYHSRINTNPASWTWSRAQIEWPVALEISKVQGHPVGMLAEAQRSFLRACRGDAVPEGCRLEDALQIQRWTDHLMKLSKTRRP